MAKGATDEPVPLLEWVSAGLGLAVALGLMGIIGREALSGGNGGDVPVLAAHIEGIERTATGNVVRITVFNQSGQAAARVQVEGKAGDETSVVSLDYVPGHSKAEGGLLFGSDPRRSGLEVRVTGYQLP